MGNKPNWKPAVTTGSNLGFIKPADLAESGITGEIVTGVYLGTSENKFDDTEDKSKPNFKVEVATALPALKLKAGDTAIINNNASLARQLRDVKTGELVRIVYNGKNTMKTGKGAGKAAHSFLVEVAE